MLSMYVLHGAFEVEVADVEHRGRTPPMTGGCCAPCWSSGTWPGRNARRRLAQRRRDRVRSRDARRRGLSGALCPCRAWRLPPAESTQPDGGGPRNRQPHLEAVKPYGEDTWGHVGTFGQGRDEHLREWVHPRLTGSVARNGATKSATPEWLWQRSLVGNTQHAHRCRRRARRCGRANRHLWVGAGPAGNTLDLEIARASTAVMVLERRAPG
jgi:hypothetical protein